jgi:quinol-cytochrome oxidoreductase complex cytochrome b subunit
MGIIIVIHIYLVHYSGSSNPSLVNKSLNQDYIDLYPYFIIKDTLGILPMFSIFVIFICFYPDILGHPDNYCEANSIITPQHIVPEWYFLFFYAILRSIPNKSLGIIMTALAIVYIVILPICTHAVESFLFNNSKNKSVYIKSLNKEAHIVCIVFLIAIWILLT